MRRPLDLLRRQLGRPTAPLRRRRRSVYSGMILAGALASGCSTETVLHAVGPIGEANARILMNAVAIMLCVIVPVIAATLGVAWWFRASNRRAVYRPGFVYSGRVEAVTWAIPLLVILFLGGLAWIGSHKLDPFRPLPGPAKPLEVEVVALDWKWLFIYPEQGVASVNYLAAPVGRPIHFRLTSDAVMNAFFVPRWGSMIYAMSGMISQLNLQVDEAGHYLGQSTQFSGDGFATMRFDAHAMTEAELDSWVEGARRSGERLDAAAYAELAKPSKAEPARMFRLDDPGLFEKIVHRWSPHHATVASGGRTPSTVLSTLLEDPSSDTLCSAD